VQRVCGRHFPDLFGERSPQQYSRDARSLDALVVGQLYSGNPDLSELYYRGIHDFDSLEGAELVRFSALMVEAFRRSEEMYYLQLEGRLEPYVWRGIEAGMREFSGYPGIQAWWRFRSHWFSEEFAKHINQLQQTAPPPRMYREPMEDE